MSWLLLLACGARDPVLGPKKDALEAWTRGEQALIAKDAAGAVAAFDQALAAQPSDPVLASWRAKALADSGDLVGAIDAAEAVLDVAPDFAELRYNRAAWLARVDRPEDAAVDLQIAFQGGRIQPATAIDDPDFASVRDHKAFVGVIPSHPLSVSVEPPTGSVFWGSDFDVHIVVIGVPDDRVVTVKAPVSGPFRFVSAIEDDTQSTSGPVRDLRFRFVVAGAGDIAIGPFEVVAGARTGQSSQVVAMPASAPPDKPAAEGSPEPLRTPREVLAGRAVPAAWREGNRVFVATAAGDHLEFAPAAPPAADWVIKRGGTAEVVIAGVDAAPGTRVVVKRGGAELLAVTP